MSSVHLSDAVHCGAQGSKLYHHVPGTALPIHFFYLLPVLFSRY